MISEHVRGDLLPRLEKIEQEFIRQFSSSGIIEHALLLGEPRQIDFLECCRAKYRHLLCEEYPKSCTEIAQLCLGQFTDLPYVKGSIDFIILPHVLEFSTEPKLILKETAECLSQHGRLILFSLSPFSRFVSHSRISLYSTKQLLRELELNVIASHSFFSLFSTLQKCKMTPFLKKLDKIVTPYLPFLGNAYFIVAQKTTIATPRMPLKSFAIPQFAMALKTCHTA